MNLDYNLHKNVNSKEIIVIRSFGHYRVLD